MYIVYILLSEQDQKLYVGCTQDLEKRIELHNRGKVKATYKRRPFSVIHTETFFDKKKAFIRERFLKSLWSARFKKKIKQNYIQKNVKYDALG